MYHPQLTCKAHQFGFPLSQSHFYKKFCQITFKYDPFNQVTQYNISNIMMRWMLLLHYLFLSPLILLYLS